MQGVVNQKLHKGCMGQITDLESLASQIESKASKNMKRYAVAATKFGDNGDKKALFFYQSVRWKVH